MAYLLALSLLSLAPGPSAVLAMGHGLNFGARRALLTVCGMESAVILMMLAAGGGAGALLAASPAAFFAVKLCGALYLMWLGLRQWHAPVHGAYAHENAPENPTENAATPILTAHRRWLDGFLCNISNPKGIVFMAAMLPQFLQPARPLAPQLAILIATTVIVDGAVMQGYAAIAARLARWLQQAAARRALNRLCGGVLILMGAALLLAGRSA
ncbi:MAG: LysE family transporter [Ottowia sp.]|nr:LysE family transporter [Ottowia sp.]